MLLATTVLGNGNLANGNGENPTVSALGNAAVEGSGTATSKAPRTRVECRIAQCATAKHPKLCATSSVFSPSPATSLSIADTQSSQIA
ncbi:hypothetical protein CFter6_4074 [Collimonas fungivorans]|uniref:Uncharacterized protein n=1 Tax=Collimonas fungivorans TaxID=158899 RepID=A0A127PG20_9BURK|nr:hypothetical protein CFter6_4074 [Collimonas fungivorans]